MGDGVSGFGEKVLLPGDTYIDGPGRQLAQGQFAQFVLDPAAEPGPHVITFQFRERQSFLTSIRFDGTGSCDLGPAYAFSVFASGPELPRRISYLGGPGTQRLTGRLRFGDYQCARYLTDIEDARLPVNAGGAFGYLTLTAAGDLVGVDPWEGTQRTFAKDVAFYEVAKNPALPPDSMWLIEAGNLVMRGESGEERARLGNEVQEFRSFESSPGGTSWVGVFTDETGTYLVDGSLAKTRIDDLSCGVSILQGSGEASGTWLAYHSPCASRALVLQHLGTGERVPIAEGVTASPRFINTGLGLRLAYLVGGSGPVGRLMLRPVRGEAVELAANADFRVLGPVRGSTIRLLVDSDGAQGTLIDKDLATLEVTKIAERVRPDFALGYLLNYDGESGDWAEISAAGTVRVIAQRVPLHVPLVLKERVLAIDNIRGATGRLIMLDPSLTRITPLAEGVPSGGFSMLEDTPVVLYLTSYNAATSTGELRVQLVTTGDDLKVSDDVSEFSATIWPKPGVLYAVPSGPRQGLWFAASR